MQAGTSFTIDMSKEDTYETINKQLSQLKTPGDINELISQMDTVTKQKYLYDKEVDRHFESIKAEAAALIDWIEDNDYINDHKRGVSRRDRMLAMLQVSALLLQQNCQRHARQEMQCQNEMTQYGMKLSNTEDDLVTYITDTVQDLVTHDCHYVAVLDGRKRQVHYTDSEGNFLPFSNNEVRAVILEYERQVQEFDEWQREMKKDPGVSQGQEDEVKQLELQLQ